MRKLYMIRHGITEGIEKHLYYGRTDMPLTEAGRALCVSEGKKWNLPDTIEYATSGMLRTEQTLELMFGAHPHKTYPDLREMNVGAFECKTYDQLKDDPAFQTWMNDTAGESTIPGGESNRIFRSRVARALDGLHEIYSGDVMLVCHGGVICSAMLYLFPEARPSFYDWTVESCHGYAIYFEDGKPVRFEEV